MYEFTHKGAWFKWSALDRTDKILAGTSIAAAALVGMIAGVAAGQTGFELGYRLASGGMAPSDSGSFLRTIGEEAVRWATFAAALLAMVSAATWLLFSRRQDEVFNRIQNHAIGQAATWSLGFAALWWLLSLGGWVGAFPLGAFLFGAFILLCVFWFRAIQRWT